MRIATYRSHWLISLHTIYYKLQSLNQVWIFSRRQIYADSISAKGSPLINVIVFIDGTIRPISRPGHYQQVAYNGHKRVHSIKFQSIVTPNGMIAHLYGPIEGRRHDVTLLRESGILEELEELNWQTRDGLPFTLYGDPAYPLRDFLQASYRNTDDAYEQLFYTRMSTVRECVEWQFGKILTYFAFLDFKKNLKIFLQPVAKMYLVGALLTNCHTCLYGSQTSDFFGLNPPAIEEYLHI